MVRWKWDRCGSYCKMNSRVLLLWALLIGHCRSQGGGEFPAPTTVGLYTTVSATASCGTQAAEDFCVFTLDATASLSPNCIVSVCNNTCPQSDHSPERINLENIGQLGSGVTVITTTTLPGTSETALFFNQSSISIESTLIPLVSVSDGFSFAAWIKQQDGKGTLLSKANSDASQRDYVITISQDTFTFDYEPSTSTDGQYASFDVSVNLSPNYFHHIAVTVYQEDFALYINGSVINATGLDGSINDAIQPVQVGALPQGSAPFNGFMQDVYYYSQALTVREVNELVTGSLPTVHLSSECHCPPSHPLINLIDPSDCIQHLGVEIQRGSASRVNPQGHPVGLINDNNFVTAWISEPNVSAVNVTVNLVEGSNSLYEMIFIFIRYGAPAPRAAVLDKSIDGGQTWMPIQFFADDCQLYFGMVDDAPLVNSDDVNCVTTYSSQSPTIGNTAVVRLFDRPGNINTPELQQFILASSLRLRIMDFFTDGTTDRHRYYNVEEFSVAARCACNGHANRCSLDATAICECMHNTQGNRCEECLPLYNNKPWYRGTLDLALPCKICDCNSHALSCHYNSSLDLFPDDYSQGGGGVCDNCQDNTDGQFCETCTNGFYRPAGVDPADSMPCLPCNCNAAGSNGTQCVKNEGIPGMIAGQCSCRTNVQGKTCDQCKEGFFNLSPDNPDGCQPCNCNTSGTVDGVTTCDSSTGQCTCKENVEGQMCNQCISGTSGLSAELPEGCSACNCNPLGSLSSTCELETGQCSCQSGVTGLKCDQCADGYFGLSETGCQLCSCNVSGSSSSACNKSTGACPCNPNVIGQACDQCQQGFYDFQSGCLYCGCDVNGTVSGMVDACHQTTGQCSCKANVQGRICDMCRPTFTGLAGSKPNGCDSCDCVTGNTNTSGDTCDPLTGQCSCLSSAMGLRCDVCLEGFYSINSTCTLCNCDENGSLSAVCDSDGQCECKLGIGERMCTQCLSGFYQFPSCLQCQCDQAGSVGTVCDDETGVCQCKEFVQGMNCDTCIEGFSLLNASNPFGCTKAPEQQSPPTLTSLNATSVLLTWSPPEEPNGVITSYTLFRSDIAIATVGGTTLTYLDAGLNPNTAYVYAVQSTNDAGNATSAEAVVITLEAPPEEVNQPVIITLNSTAIQTSWIAPNKSNGAIVLYEILIVAEDKVSLDSPVTVFSGQGLSATIGDLSPFTLYSFVLRACTSAGCSLSEQENGSTDEAAPEFQAAPSVSVVDSSTLLVSWIEPSQPNGFILQYKIYQRSIPFIGEGSLAGFRNYSIFSLEVDGLLPFTEYEFSVESITIAGGTYSNWTRNRTAESFPVGVAAPQLSVVSSTEIMVQWSEPIAPNGVITEYRIYISGPGYNIFTLIHTAQLPGSEIISGLSPFSQYTFTNLVCTSVGCTSSSSNMATTFESAPVGIAPPTVVSTQQSSIQLSWSGPSQPNGIITNFTLTRSRPSLLPSPRNQDLGTSFYGTNYAAFPASANLGSISTSISFSFKTLQTEGVFLYFITTSQEDYLAVELRDGILWFLFDAGSGPAAIRTETEKKFNDGQWHNVEVSRNGKNGQVTVDGLYAGTGQSPGANTFLSTGTNALYIGGVEDGVALTTVNGESNPNATLGGYSFAGCIFGMSIKGVPLNFSEQINPNTGVGAPGLGCPRQLERGVTFLGGGYLSMPLTLQPASQFSISLWMRTTAQSGLVLFSSGNDSYLSMELVDSNIVVRVKENGANEVLLMLTLTGSPCDGQWHRLEFQELGDALVFMFDGDSIAAEGSSFKVDLASPIFLGGLTQDGQASYMNYIGTSPKAFSGCLRELAQGGVTTDMFRDNIGFQLVRFDGCDNSTVPNATCVLEEQDFSVELSTQYQDANLPPFTEFIYQVAAENSVGAVYSDWTPAMTGEAAPSGVGQVVVGNRTSTTMMLSWQQPSVPNGLVIRYSLVAIPTSTIGLDTPTGGQVTVSLNVTVPDMMLQASLSGLDPATTYTVTLTAFTSNGNGSGAPLSASTLYDVPSGVQVPTVIMATLSSFTFSWDPPARPNGDIVLYRLFLDGGEVFSGQGMTATAGNLSPFMSYEFHLEACTSVGCSNGTLGSNMTLEAAPDGLAPPTLTELSPTSIQATWTPPTQPNGVILYYELVRVFPDFEEQVEFTGQDVVAVVLGLTPNTQYSFKVVAYNGGGSTSSATADIITPEDTPDQVLPPEVVVINSSSLLINWQEPLQPNGIIVNYTLRQNATVVFSGSGQQLSYVSAGLLPFTYYSYSIMACTQQGCSSSSLTVGLTAEATPEGFVTPNVTVLSSTMARITIIPPTQPNGIVTYLLQLTAEFLIGYNANGTRNTVNETRLVYNDSNPGVTTVEDLLPFSQFQVQLEIANSAGSLVGDSIQLITSPAAPELLAAPVVTVQNSTSLAITWTPPQYPNGIISSFQLSVIRGQVTQELNFISEITSAVVTDLLPFTDYQVVISANNSVGSVYSPATPITTGETDPEDLDPATVLSVTPYSALIAWDPPAVPNGIILNYTVVVLNTEEFLTVEATETEANVTGLFPFVNYVFAVIACNSAGCVTSPAVTATTDEAPPKGVSAPILSTTSSAVVIIWQPPSQPNGQLLGYNVYRLTEGTQPVLLKSVNASVFLFIDSSVTPFTSYMYYIEAENFAGLMAGPSSTVISPEAAPLDVPTPVLLPLSSSSIEVTAFPPQQPNGVITQYLLVRQSQLGSSISITLAMPNPSAINFSYTDTGLQPYTNYSYSVTACTAAGCSSGDAASKLTLEAPPLGQLAPSTILFQDGVSVLVSWQPPQAPNGQIVSYILLRANVGYSTILLPNCCEQYLYIVGESEGLQSGLEPELFFSEELCNTIAIVEASVTSYSDGGLQNYFLYQYCVVATNNAGSTHSDYSEEFRTKAAPAPLAGPNATAEVINSTAIMVYWSPLNVSILLGPLGGYTLYGKISGSEGPGSVQFSGMAMSHLVTSLEPSTQYTFVVEVSNGEGATFGSEVTVETMSGIPVGVARPIVLATNATSLTITWQEPDMPNGDIIRYSIFFSSMLLSNETGPGSLVVTGLKPFTLYTAQVEACTEYGCAKSSLSSNRTLEAPPAGLASPTVSVLGPYSVMVSWTSPIQSNGIITEYQLYQRQETSCMPGIMGKCYNTSLIFSGLAFEFNITDLQPFTSYGYEVVAVNGGGNISSGFTTETTGEAAPSFIFPPVLAVLSDSEIRVDWTLPEKPNGFLLSHHVFRNGTEVFLTISSTLTYFDSELKPFTMYSYTLQSCTSAGCTNSTMSVATTNEASPEQVADPVISVLQARSLTISWSPPALPNGIIIYYLLSFANSNTNIANTTGFSFVVENLAPYTNYSFVLTACNSAGCGTSNATTVQTLEAPPEGFDPPTANSLSTTSVEIAWSPPSAPNGIITSYVLLRDKVVVFEGLELQFVDTQLIGDTQYTYTVVAVNSAGNVTGIISIHTQVGIPEGLAAPVVTVLNSTTVYVQWGEPVQAHGVISSYKVVFNGVVVFQELAFEATVSILLPFTSYSVHVEACNQAGCASSTSVFIKTEEAPPQGLSPPEVTVLTATSVYVSWTEPSQPNGELTQYQIFRRFAGGLIPLIQFVGPNTTFSFENTDLLPFTSYEYQLVAVNGAGSTASEWVGVTTFEAPPAGVGAPTFPTAFIQPTNITALWSAPQMPNGVIISYELLYRMLLDPNTEVLVASVSANTTQAIAIGLTPFTVYEFQVVAYNDAGMGKSPFSPVTTAEAVPDGLSTIMVVNRTNETLGLFWVQPTVPNGLILEYAIYLDGKEEYRGIDTMFTVDRLKPFTSYLVQLEACNSAGCTLGAVQSITTEEGIPIGQPPPTLVATGSTTIKIDWEPPLQPNGIMVSYAIFRIEVANGQQEVNDTSNEVLVHFTNDVTTLQYNDTSVFPAMAYMYAILGSNSVGSSKSAFHYVETPQAPPVGVQPPSLAVLGTSSILVSWSPPTQPNGVIDSYSAYRSNQTNPVPVQVYSGLNPLFTDTGLEPFTQYSYVIEACTSGITGGCTNGSASSATTDESTPEFLDPPSASALSSMEINIVWTPPGKPNGIITLYVVDIQPVGIQVSFTDLAVNITDLQPYTFYTVTVQACTMVGCVTSQPSLVQTLEAPPQGTLPPTVFALGPTSVQASWKEPLLPNGVITRYLLRRNNTIIFDGLQSTYIDSDLQPDRTYAYDIQAFTSAGGGDRSTFSIVTTNPDTPTGIAPPSLTPVSATAILALWQVPSVPNGEILNYTLYVDNTPVFTGLTLGFQVENLSPFTSYSFRVEACTTTCGSSLSVQETTPEGVPQDFAPPTATTFSNISVLLTWSPPGQPNGIIQTYTVLRRALPDGNTQSVFTVSSSTQYYLDADAVLAPAMPFEYSIIATNGEESATSDPVTVTLPDALPEGVSVPQLIAKTSQVVSLIVDPPAVPNGAIVMYALYQNGSQVSEVVPSTPMSGASFEVSGLLPFTPYAFHVESCTSVGCVAGAVIVVTTNEDVPEGLGAPIATAVDARNIYVEWIPPIKPNGVILSYSLWYQLACPQPPMFPTVTTPSCFPGSYTSLLTSAPASTLSHFFSNEGNDDPFPYTAYRFLLQAGSAAGKVNSTISDIVITPASLPEVIRKPTITQFNMTRRELTIDWKDTFRLNGQLIGYTVLRDGYFLLSTPTDTSAELVNQPGGRELLYQVQVSTNIGETSTESIPIFFEVDPGVTTPTETVTESPTAVIPPFYTQAPFISGVVLLFLLLLFLCFVGLLCFVRPSGSFNPSTVKSIRGDGTTRASWSPVAQFSTGEVPLDTSFDQMPPSSSHGSHSYSPTKATEQQALLDNDFSGGELALQDTHIRRFSKSFLNEMTVQHYPPAPASAPPPSYHTARKMSGHGPLLEDSFGEEDLKDTHIARFSRVSLLPEPVEVQETTFMDTKV